MRDTGMLKCWIAKVYNETARAAEVDCAEVEPGRKGATAESLEDGGVLRQKRLTQVMCVVMVSISLSLLSIWRVEDEVRVRQDVPESR